MFKGCRVLTPNKNIRKNHQHVQVPKMEVLTLHYLQIRYLNLLVKQALEILQSSQHQKSKHPRSTYSKVICSTKAIELCRVVHRFLKPVEAASTWFVKYAVKLPPELGKQTIYKWLFITLPDTDSSPLKLGLLPQKENHLPNHPFSGAKMLVSGVCLLSRPSFRHIWTF